MYVHVKIDWILYDLGERFLYASIK